MAISKIFEKKKVVYSFEIFPPKKTSKIDIVYKTIDDLSSLNPDFISVTYGAGGSVTDNRTIELSSLIKNKYNIESLAHLTCINSSKEYIENVINELNKNNVTNILALRGDIPSDTANIGDFNYASDLIKFVKNKSDIGISAACYLEGHADDKDLRKAVEILKMKEELGAQHFISQLFLSNDVYYDFMNRVYQKNINVPIEAGIMPVTNRKQIERMVKLTGVSLPYKFLKIIDKYEDSPEALEEAGIYYAIDQIIDLISSGVRGIHLYTMNRPDMAKKITKAIEPILNSVNSEESNTKIDLIY